MPKKDVNTDNVRITVPPPAESPLKQVDDVFIIVTQAYCPNGHNLIADDNDQFDGYPGIKIHLSGESGEGIVYLSPIHGDGTKRGYLQFRTGEKLRFSCPQCHAELPTFAHCHCHIHEGEEGELVKFYTSPDLSDSHIIAVCNVWGCRRSCTIDSWNIISEYLDGEITD